MQIQRVEQRDANASVGRRREQRGAHRIGVAVAGSVRLVVDVVELADGGDTSKGHL